MYYARKKEPQVPFEACDSFTCQTLRLNLPYITIHCVRLTLIRNIEYTFQVSSSEVTRCIYLSGLRSTSTHVQWHICPTVPFFVSCKMLEKGDWFWMLLLLIRWQFSVCYDAYWRCKIQKCAAEEHATFRWHFTDYIHSHSINVPVFESNATAKQHAFVPITHRWSNFDIANN